MKPRNDLPGPGYYNKAIKEIELKSTHEGFTLQEKRFKDLSPQQTLTVSPAHYLPKTAVYSTSLSESLSAVFKSPIVEGAGHAHEFKHGPAPNAYKVEIPLLGATQGAKNVFKSGTVRQTFQSGSSDPKKAPPPVGSYEVDDSTLLKSVPGAVASFKAPNRNDIANRLFRNTIKLGPGSYNLTTVPPKHVKKQLAPRPSWHSDIKSQIELKKLREGPPGPGRYNVAHASDKIYESGVMTKGAFKGSSDRLKRLYGNTEGLPGPGSYDASPSMRRTYHLNLSGKWSR